MAAHKSLCTVESCRREVADAYVCQSCADELRACLRQVPELTVELETTRSRQVRFGDPVGARVWTRPVLPYDPRATEAIYVLRSALVGWVRLVAEETGSARMPLDTLPGLAGWLLGEVEYLRHHQAGHEAVEELSAALRLCQAVVDRPSERWYAGPCDGCGSDVYARAGYRMVECACGASYDLTSRREWLLDSVADVLATAVEISRALSTLDQPVTAERIRQWRVRGQILARASDAQGHPLYRVGDVLELLEKSPRGVPALR